MSKVHNAVGTEYILHSMRSVSVYVWTDICIRSCMCMVTSINQYGVPSRCRPDKTIFATKQVLCDVNAANEQANRLPGSILVDTGFHPVMLDSHKRELTELQRTDRETEIKLTLRQTDNIMIRRHFLTAQLSVADHASMSLIIATKLFLVDRMRQVDLVILLME